PATSALRTSILRTRASRTIWFLPAYFSMSLSRTSRARSPPSTSTAAGSSKSCRNSFTVETSPDCARFRSAFKPCPFGTVTEALPLEIVAGAGLAFNLLDTALSPFPTLVLSVAGSYEGGTGEHVAPLVQVRKHRGEFV